jgi:hypothetical protein
MEASDDVCSWEKVPNAMALPQVTPTYLLISKALASQH